MRGDEPAFPCDVLDFQPTTGEQVVRQSSPGVSVRLWLAAQAMQGMLANSAFVDDMSQAAMQYVSTNAFDMADVMLKHQEAAR